MASKEIKDLDSKPPEGQNLVKDLLCPQLLLAILAGGAFAYTLAKPIEIGKVVVSKDGAKQGVTATKTGGPVKSKDADPAIDNDHLAADVDKQKPLLLYNQGKKAEANKAAWDIAKDVNSRRDIKKLLAAGSVLIKSTELKDKWKGWLLLDKAIHKMPRARYVKAYYANRQYEFGKMREAIESYEDAIKLGPDDWIEPRLRLGELCIKDEQGAKAVRLFEDTLKTKPDEPRIMEKLGIATAVAGDSDKGFEIFSKGANIEFDTMDYHPDIRALQDKHGGLTELAITEQKKVVAAKPDSVEERIKLARLLILVSRLDQAQTELEEARKHKESDPEIYFVLANVQNRRGDFKEAANAFASGVRCEAVDKPAVPSEQKYLPTYEDGLEEERLTKEEDAAPAPPPAAEEKPAETAPAEKPAQPKPDTSTKSPDEE